MIVRCCCCLGFLLAAACAMPLEAGEFALGEHRFALPDGLEIQRVAGPPLVDRPICADFDEQGRLYVADSSGTNDPVQTQLEQRPHRVVCLIDTDNDGTFDDSHVFADQLMFPEGVLWHEGSLYVAAPPSIWKLTDADGDGVAEQREEWFAGKTLTGCANDLHGPYRGPDGWIYWCKGAFAEQTYERSGREPLVTKAAHIFRRNPRSGEIEPVMTGGMDNPVELVFTAGGERLFTTTFLQHPGGGMRDGMLHAVYGGVYGKVHAVLDGHPRTGDVMPVLTHMGPAAPCGLVSLESNALGEDWQHNVLACSFNMHKVTRHVLHAHGATFRTTDSDLVVSDNIDFHPTDVLEDADGSLLIIDTGGWYKLCCPTSHLHKPDILGAIYRVRRSGAARPEDPRGLQLAWSEGSGRQPSAAELTSRLEDPRHAVRRRAMDELAQQGAAAIEPLHGLARRAHDAAVRRAALWTLIRIDAPDARAAVRTGLDDPDPLVRQVACYGASLWRDADATTLLVRLLDMAEPAAVRRVAAEALGRIGDAQALPALLTASNSSSGDRFLEHSLIYAVWELDQPQRLHEHLDSLAPGALRAALVALDQSRNGRLTAETVVPLLDSPDPQLRETATWIIDHRPQWATSLVGYLRRRLGHPPTDAAEQEQLVQQLASFAKESGFQQHIAAMLRDEALTTAARKLILAAMARAEIEQVPEAWARQLASLLSSVDDQEAAAAVATAAAWSGLANVPSVLRKALHDVGAKSSRPHAVRLEALAASRLEGELTADLFNFVSGQLDPALPLARRLLAADVLATASLSPGQLEQLIDRIDALGPMELGRLLRAFEQSADDVVGLKLVAALSNSPSLSGVPVALLRTYLKSYGPPVQQRATELYAKIDAQSEAQRQKFEQLLETLNEGDIRRGQAVFYGSKAACSTCHAIGYLGGTLGPDLTRIASIRAPRDLLESIVFPSASFVRSYEPLTVVTVDGQVHNGVPREESTERIVLALAADKTVTIDREDIEEILPGKVSVMPAGLDQQLTPQELADLLAFLSNAR